MQLYFCGFVTCFNGYIATYVKMVLILCCPGCLWLKGYYRAGKCHLAMGSIGNATRCLQKVLEKDPKNKDAQNDVSYLYQYKLSV